MLGNFSKIKVESGIELAYTESSEFSLTVEAGTDKIMKNIITELEGNTLRVYYTKAEELHSVKVPLKVYVNANNVDFFEALTQSKLVFKNSVKSDAIKITVSSGASFIGTVAKNSKAMIRADSGATVCGRFDTEYLHGNIKSGAIAVLSGTAKKATISTSSGACCKAKNLETDDVSIFTKGLSSVQIYGQGKISAHAEAGSSISYFSKPDKITLSPDSYSITRNIKEAKMKLVHK